MNFPVGRSAPPARGGRGDSDLPPMPPWTPYTPFKRPRGYPRTPLVPPRARPLVSRPTGSSIGHAISVWFWASNQSGTRAGTHFARLPWPQHVLPQGTPAVTVPCHHSKDRPAPRSRGGDQLRQAAFSPKANTRVAKRLGFHEVKANLEGDSGPPAGTDVNLRWARPCEASGALLLSDGGTGGGHRRMHPLAAPGALLGTFPRGEKPLGPPAGGRKPLPQRQAPTPTKAPSSPRPPFNTQRPCPPHQGARPRIQTHGNCNIKPTGNQIKQRRAVHDHRIVQRTQRASARVSGFPRNCGKGQGGVCGSPSP